MTQSRFVVTASSGFELEAKKEIGGLIPAAKVRNLFFKGNLLVECPEKEEEVIPKLRDAQTLYLGRVFPVSSRVEISSRKESLSELYEQVLLLKRLRKGESFIVRCRRRGSHDFTSQDVERELGSLLEKETGAVVDLENPEKIVTVQIFQSLAFVGVAVPEDVLVKQIRVFRKYEKGKRPFTRAQHKIEEAIEAFGFRIGEDYEILDLGAAPGGWARVLSGLAKKVVAVDPAELDREVAVLPNVIHYKCRAEEIPEEAGEFDLITNDMNLSPSESAEIMVDLADRLREDGIAMMTVKFVTRNRKKHVNEAIGILEARYKDFKVKRLPHNRYETTLLMRKL